MSTAGDGPVALEALAGCRPDAVILDLMLPTLGGLEVCGRMRSSGEFVPILMLTARDAVTDRVTGLDAKLTDFLGQVADFRTARKLKTTQATELTRDGTRIRAVLRLLNIRATETGRMPEIAKPMEAAASNAAMDPGPAL